MKKIMRPLALVLAMALLAGGGYAAASGDSLISLSYLMETFFPQAERAWEDAANAALDKTYRQSLDDLATAAGRNGDQGGVLTSADLRAREWSDGQIITLQTGGGCLLLDGVAQVTHNGAVVDITDGCEVASGGRLTVGHRYLVGEDTAAQLLILSGWASVGVEGSYTVSPGIEDPTPFADVSRNDWFYSAVSYVYGNKLFAGVESHRFGAGIVMTRGMLMTVLYQLAGAPVNELAAADVVLTDVPDDAWFAPYVRWGVSQGVATGTGNGTFSPNLQITREQVVVLLYSFAHNYLGRTMSPGADLSGYQDGDKVSSWAVEPMQWAASVGVISGASDGAALYLNPQGYAGRAEVAAMLRVFSGQI